MKGTMIYLMVIVSLFLQASCGREPVCNDIIGIWKNPDGAEFIFDKNGAFSGKKIPSQFGFMPIDSLKNKNFNGSGKWTLKKGSANWEVYVEFDKVSVNKNGCAFPLLLAGENGILANKPPWYLFVWKEEEGGERYKFAKQN